MASKEKQLNPNGLAIVEAMKAHEGETLAFVEIANLAKVDAKTGYLTSAKKIASEQGFSIEKVENGVTAKAHIETEYPSGLKVEADKEIVLDGYRIIKA